MSKKLNKNNKPKKKQEGFLAAQLRLEQRKAEREAKSRKIYDVEDIEDDDPVDESEDEKENAGESNATTFKLFQGGLNGVTVKNSTLRFHVGGKNVSPEVAFNTMNSAAYVAALYMMNNPDENNAGDLETYIATAIQMIGLYGPLNDISFDAVHACICHIQDNNLDLNQIVRKKHEEIRDNLPRAVNADAVVSGVAAMDMDLTTQKVVIKDHEDLAERAKDTMGLLNQAVFTKPGTAALDVIAEIGGLNPHLQSLPAQLNSFIAGAELPTIKETNPFRKLTNRCGLMSAVPVAVGTHGLLQNAYRCLKAYMRKSPDVMLVPGYNQTLTGSWDSHTSASRVIPLPDDSKLSSLALYSIVAPYEDGLRRGADIEAELAEDNNKKNEANARSILHAKFQDEYDRFKQVGVGVTGTNVAFVTLYGHKPLSIKKFREVEESGLLGNRPALMRAADYLQLIKGRCNGEFVWTDLPNMVGLYMSHEFIQTYVKEKYFVPKTRTLQSTDGWYVFAKKLDKWAKNYATLLSKYMFCFLSAKVVGDPKVFNTFYEKYFGNLLLKSKQNASSLGVLKKLNDVYGKVNPSMSRITILFPGYSSTKALKYSTRIMGKESSEDDSGSDDRPLKRRRADDDYDVGGDEEFGDDQSADDSYVPASDEEQDPPPPEVGAQGGDVSSSAGTDPTRGTNG